MGALDYLNLGKRRPLRVAAYCRESTGQAQQEESYDNQEAFFTRAIREHEGWECAGIYGDRARTGRYIKGRESFLRMIGDAEAGRMDYILVKSVSRFSRSAADTVAVLRQLRAAGVGVLFLEQGIDSLSGEGELALTAAAAIAEMESESISLHTRQIFEAMNKRGTPLTRCRYGYRREGLAWVPVPGEAVRIKLIYLMAAEGYSFAETARRLNLMEKRDATGRCWTGSMVKGALLSEVYIGDILTNKSVAVWDGNGRKWVENRGNADRYAITNHHEPMVSRALGKKLSGLCRRKKLAGQRGFSGKRELRSAWEMAEADPLLDAVRKEMPREKPRCERVRATGGIG